MMPQFELLAMIIVVRVINFVVKEMKFLVIRLTMYTLLFEIK